MDELLSEIHAKAWGKHWPQDVRTIRRDEIYPPTVALTAAANEDIDLSADNHDADAEPHDDDDASEWTYTCLRDITRLAQALFVTSDLTEHDTIVVQADYYRLRELLESQKGRAVVVTGQPGIGKSTFLLYLFLYRLERELPTAIQFSPGSYLMFDRDGATRHDEREEPHDVLRLSRCWGLSDSNVSLLVPCAAFRAYCAKIVQASSPRRDRWKDWIKQSRGRLLIANLPRSLEVAAIAKANTLDPVLAITIMNKWGPCIRTIFDILLQPEQEDFYQGMAISGAELVCKDSSIAPSLFSPRPPSSEASTILFIRPGPNAEGSRFLFYIPTPHLADIMYAKRKVIANEKVVELYDAFSMHSFMRSAAGWLHERNMHIYLSSSADALDVTFSTGEVSKMSPTRRLLPGMPHHLKNVKDYEAFYWFPCVANFPGIDAVLCNGTNIYLLQATIAAEHGSPIGGIRKVWESMDKAVRNDWAWHFVVVAEDMGSALRFSDEFVAELKKMNFKLGRKHVQVQVGACVLPK